MPSSRHHTEWLSLIEVSGPFLSVPVLERVFPQGLDAHDPDHVRVLRLAFDEWEDDRDSDSPRPAIHREWIRFVLKETLGLPSEVLAEGQDIPQTLMAKILEHGETLRPDVVVRNPSQREAWGVEGGAKNPPRTAPHAPRLLVQVYPPEQNLEKPITGRHWKASPATRMMELLHATDVRLGLITNGEHWMLVDAPKGETTGFASWYATLWSEEPLTLRAFRSLLGVSRFFSVADDETLEQMLKDSASHQQEVTVRLGYQVREAVEEIIRALDRIDQDEKRQLLAGVSEPELYRAALTVMMRLVFLFSAEERGLLLLGDPLYDEHYAVSTLVARLQETADQHGEEILERRHDAWVRLLSTFRAVFGGVQHERMKLLPYAGNLFDPDQFPFLEGRKQGTTWKDTPATPLLIDNRTVLHLLRSLQYLELHGEARRLSFRALGIEQIGHVYEGLLDHTAKRATELVVSLTAAKGDEPEVALSELERLAWDAGHGPRVAGGEWRVMGGEQVANNARLIAFLKERTGRSESALKKALLSPVPATLHPSPTTLRTACGNDDVLFNRVRPFSGLVRNDTFDRPVVIRKGSVFVTAGTDRRSSGTHYTPRSLTEPIVQYTLEPLVYVGPAEGKPKEEWKLRTAKELLDLKICDMACGSGAFLVQACRYMSERLVEAWEDAEKRHPGVPGITPEGTTSTGAANEQLIPKDTDERLAYARRMVAQRCLYGVDKNPLAVEMAKLSLWLLTLAKDKPFTFLDHAIRCGDSLVGIRDIRQVQYFQVDLDQADRSLFAGPVMSLVDEAMELRKKIESLPANTIEDVREKEQLLFKAEEKTARLRCAADLLISVEFQPVSSAGEKEALHNSMAIQAGHYVQNGTIEDFRAAAQKVIDGQRTFHWPLEFPEVCLERGGFDALVCNPPFMGGLKLETAFGTEYRAYLVRLLARGIKGVRGTADLCSYFILRAAQIVRPHGNFGMLATNTIAQGDSRSVGLEQLAQEAFCIYRAEPSRSWPGEASIEIVKVWLHKGKWNGEIILGQTRTTSISSFLTEEGTVTGNPYRLVSNTNTCFQGSIILGMGFVLEENEARSLIVRNPKNKHVLYPYLNGLDVNSDPTSNPSRWVINFFDWPLERKLEGEWNSADESNRAQWLREGRVPQDYPGPVAEDYPDCLSILRIKVQPEREKLLGKNDMATRRGTYWWRHASDARNLYKAIRGIERAIVFAQTSKTKYPVFKEANLVFDQKTIVIASSDAGMFAILCSQIHYHWIVMYGSSLRTDPVYTPSNCFETFPFPLSLKPLREKGERYHAERQIIMVSRNEGLTKTYNRFHDPDEISADIKKLRDLHVEMDKAVAAAYGWSDLDLGHGFHETKQGIRFTISESARREILARLLKLNHERYAEEVKQGLHDKKGKAKPVASGRGRKSKASTSTPSLKFGDDEDDPDPPYDTDEEPTPTRKGTSSKTSRADHRVQPTPTSEPPARPTPIDQIETHEIMAAFRQAARGEGWLDRDELLKEVSLVLGYQRLGPKIDESLRGHLRAAIRRRIIETDGPNLVRAGTVSMADYEPDELVEVFRSVMRTGTRYDREEVILALARHFGFVRLTETIREPISEAITHAICHRLLGYEGSVIWRSE